MNKKNDYSAILVNKTPYCSYYMTLYELQTNNLSIKNLNGFRYQSIYESILWENELSRVAPRIPNSFYAVLQEMKFIAKEFVDRSANDDMGNFFSSLALRCTILGFILNNCDTRLIYGELKKINDKLYNFFSKCNQLSSLFGSEFQIDDYNLLVTNLNSSSDLFTSSIYLKELTQRGEEMYSLIESLQKDKILDRFFSPYEYVKKSLIGMTREYTSQDVLDVVSFKNSFLYITAYGESSFLSYIFVNKSRYSDVLMLESLRLISKIEKEYTNDAKLKIFREAFASYVFLGKNENSAELEKAIMQSQNIIHLKKKFWVENNKRRVRELSYELKETTREIFNDFMEQMTKSDQRESYYLLFANLHNTVQKKLIEKKSLYPLDGITKEDVSYIAKELSIVFHEIILDKTN